MSLEHDIEALGEKLTAMSNEEGRQADEWTYINDMHACVQEMDVLCKELRKAENQKAYMNKET